MNRLSRSLQRRPWLVTMVGASTALTLRDEVHDAKDDENERKIATAFSSFQTSGAFSIFGPSASLPYTTQCFVDWFTPPEAKTKNPITSTRALKRYETVLQMNLTSTKEPLESKYIWHKQNVLGVGAYGSVYLATVKATNEKVALKEISKRYTNSVNFQQEMNAMMYIRKKGGHPHLCSLRENFDSPDYYYVILDYIGGGEMFDHLIQNGAYSELDASRLVQEVASALNFLHGIGVVHADLKPENILLTTSRRGDAVVKLADFGCAQLLEHADNGETYEKVYGAPTPAYSPPESLLKTHPIEPPADMWALGVILFIMMTGAHPFDLKGDTPDDEVEKRIMDPNYEIPIYNSKVTSHLSESAKDLISKLMDRDPTKRLTALQMLQHPWIRGETASTTVITGSDEKLSKFRRIQSKLQAKFFEAAINWSDDADDETRGRSSLLEQSFKALGAEQGYLTTNQILGTTDDEGPTINMSDFKELLKGPIKHQHFPAGQVVYREGEIGNHMYFIDSGTIEVVTKDGSRAIRSHGDFFGEGALLSPSRKRSATVTCTTPVHALEISREYFDKYIAASETGLFLTLKEKDKIRKRNRAKAILSLQENLKTVHLPLDGEYFKEGEKGDSMFILESGKVDLLVDGNFVFGATPGNIYGEHSVLTGNRRNCTAKCASPEGCVARELNGYKFRQLVKRNPHLRESIKDLQLRREFKKAVVRRLQKQFPYQNPQEAFKAADEKELGFLDRESITKLMRDLNPNYSNAEIEKMMQALDLTTTGEITYEEFKKLFISDIRKAASM